MRQFILIAIVISLSIQSFGQGCGLVSGTSDKETGLRTDGAILTSKDFVSLLIQKRIDPRIPNDTLNYLLFLHAASKAMLSDSMLNSTGSFELFLTNGDRIIIHNAVCENNPLGFGPAIGFSVRTSELNIIKIMHYPIRKINVFGILETEFSPRKQKRQQKIVRCLIGET